jgi:hypothetical protein
MPPRSHLSHLLLVLLFLAIFACGRIKVRSEHDPGTDFSRLKTYEWLPDPDMLSLHPLIRSAERDARVKSIVDRELSRKGYEKLVSGKPDLQLRYLASIRRNLASKTVRESGPMEDPEGLRWRRIGSVQTYSVDYQEGSLVIFISRPGARSPIWSGVAEAVLDESAPPEKRRERLRAAIQQIMEKFPPK